VVKVQLKGAVAVEFEQSGLVVNIDVPLSLAEPVPEAAS
jgi:hypothetical protein